MDSRKVTFVATIAVIVLAAVGIGFAYTAMTTNSGNSSTVELVTLTQDGDGAYTFANAQNVFWNTADEKENGKYYTTYKLTETTGTITVDAAYKAVQIGQSFTIKTNQEGGSPATLNAMVTATGFTKQVEGAEIFLSIQPAGGSEVFFKLMSNNTFIKWSGSAWTDNTFTIPYNAGYKDLTVKVYYGTLGTGVKVEHAKGAVPVGPSGTPISSGTLTFKAFTAGANGTTQQITAITASPASNINKAGSTTLTATVTNTAPVTWESTNTSIATVTDGGVVTGVASGKVLIIATTDKSGYSYAHLVTVNPQVTFNGNGSDDGSMEAQNITYKSATTLTENDFTKTGFTFAGWNTAANGSGISYTDEQSVTLTSDLTLYAQWTPTS